MNCFCSYAYEQSELTWIKKQTTVKTKTTLTWQQHFLNLALFFGKESGTFVGPRIWKTQKN